MNFHVAKSPSFRSVLWIGIALLLVVFATTGFARRPKPVASPSHPFTWGYDNVSFQTTSNTSGTTISVHPSATVPVGKVLVAYCISRYPSTPTHVVSDSKGNTWTSIAAAGNSDSGMHDSAGSIWVAKVTSALSTTDTITLTTGATTLNKGIQVRQFTNAGTTISTWGTGTQGTNSNPGTVTLNSVPSGTKLWVGLVAEGNPGATTAWTDNDAPYVIFQMTSAGGVGVGTVDSKEGHLIQSVTSDTFFCTWTGNTDWVAVIGAIDAS